MSAEPLTITPLYTGQPSATCPAKQQTVFVPDDTLARELKYCEACQSCHRVVFPIGGDRNKPALRSL